jgi:hypothetical protein
MFIIILFIIAIFKNIFIIWNKLKFIIFSYRLIQNLLNNVQSFELEDIYSYFYYYLSHYDYNYNERWKFRGTPRWPRRHTGCALLL